MSVSNYYFCCSTKEFGGSPSSTVTSPKGGCYLFSKSIESGNSGSSFMDFTITMPYKPSFKINKIVASPTNPITILQCANNSTGGNLILFTDNTTLNPQLVKSYEYTLFNSNAQGQVLSQFGSTWQSTQFDNNLLSSKTLVIGNYYIIRIGYVDFCGNVKTTDGLVKVNTLPPIAVDFYHNPPIGSGIFTPIPSGSLASAPALLGNITCGIVSTVQTNASYQLSVTIYDGNLQAGYFSLPNAPAGYSINFNDIKVKGELNYFKKNWNTIKDKYLFKVVVKAANLCGEYEQSGYFMITGSCQDCKVQKNNNNASINPNFDKMNIEEENSSILVSPNPVSSVASIVAKGVENGIVSIVNTSGQVMPLSIESTQDRIDIDMANFPSGVYFYQLRIGDTVHSGKISKI